MTTINHSPIINHSSIEHSVGQGTIADVLDRILD